MVNINHEVMQQVRLTVQRECGQKISTFLVLEYQLLTVCNNFTLVFGYYVFMVRQITG